MGELKRILKCGLDRDYACFLGDLFVFVCHLWKKNGKADSISKGIASGFAKCLLWSSELKEETCIRAALQIMEILIEGADYFFDRKVEGNLSPRQMLRSIQYAKSSPKTKKKTIKSSYSSPRIPSSLRKEINDPESPTNFRMDRASMRNISVPPAPILSATSARPKDQCRVSSKDTNMMQNSHISSKGIPHSPSTPNRYGSPKMHSPKRDSRFQPQSPRKHGMRSPNSPNPCKKSQEKTTTNSKDQRNLKEEKYQEPMSKVKSKKKPKQKPSQIVERNSRHVLEIKNLDEFSEIDSPKP